jgi:hypothetical protein
VTATDSSGDIALELDADLDTDVGAALELELESEREGRRWSRIAIGLVVAFVVSRAIAGYVADHPLIYGPHRADGTGDVHLYDFWTWQLRHTSATAYHSLHIEYPPGALPFMFIPRFIRAVSYRTEFIFLMVMVDAVGLVGLIRLARRTGVWWGVAAWMVLIPALGPVSYTRLDLVVAVALVWCIERAYAGRWGHAGALLGVGIAVKLVPVLLLPVLLAAAPRGKRRWVLGCAIGVVAVTLVPFALSLPDIWHSVIGYHSKRGVQSESTWGSVLLLVHRWNHYPAEIVVAFGAYDIKAAVAPTLKTISNVLDLIAFAGISVLAWRRPSQGDPRRLTLLALAAMSLYIALGRVYSPQYLTWIIALAAAALTFAPRMAKPAAAALAAVVVLAHIEFPFWFWDVVYDEKGGALAVLLARNLLTVVIGILALWGWRQERVLDTIDLT